MTANMSTAVDTSEIKIQKTSITKPTKIKKITTDKQTDQPWYTMEQSQYSPDTLSKTEWLLTDGLGGYAMGTALGLNTKRYHGLLIHATKPPLSRVMLVNALAEEFIISKNENSEQNQRFPLSYHEFADGTIGPGDTNLFNRFEKGLDFVRWVWEVDQYEISKTLRLDYHIGSAEVEYTTRPINKHRQNDQEHLTLAIRPLTRIGNHHHLHNTTEFRRSVAPAGCCGVDITGSAGELYIDSDKGSFELNPIIWHHFKYREESARGLEDTENLHNPGVFIVPVNTTTDEFSCRLRLGATREQIERDFQYDTKRNHLKRINHKIKTHAPNLVKKRPILIAASDDFVVPRKVRGRSLKTILAGYPWFSDWGRDTCICVPGLLLATGRYEEALDTLRTFAEYRQDGLIPNVFDDIGGAAHYNTVDAPLWFCHAVCEYLHQSGDHNGFNSHLKEACLDVIAYYQHGTDFNIKMDEDDGLIAAGDENTQLTWMDARRDGVTFTPRYGKAVEINALWYHDLLAVADAIDHDDAENAKRLRDLAGYVGPNLRESFWCNRTKCLYDCLYPEEKENGKTVWVRDQSIRPNQLFAVSLTHSAFNDRQQKSIVRTCEKELLTPVGMRTLSPQDEKYRPRFEGDMFNRDGAYHQGTVWPWLIGPFTEAYLRSHDFSKSSIRKCKTIINKLLNEMNPPNENSISHGTTSTRSLGQLFEVYDGDDSTDRPRLPGGCMAQAWSVSEVLRILVLIENKEKNHIPIPE